MPGLPVQHQFPEFTQIHVHLVGDAIQPPHTVPSPSPPAFNFTQTHVHRVHDAIQPSHPLSSPSPPTFNLSQDQGLFK